MFYTMCVFVARRSTYGKFRVVIYFSFGDILGFRGGGLSSHSNGARVKNRKDPARL